MLPRSRILSYIARRLVCDPSLLETPGVHIIPVREPDDPNFLGTTARRQPDIICATSMGDVLIIRHHPEPAVQVSGLLSRLADAPAAEALARLDEAAAPVRPADVEPYYFLDPTAFIPAETGRCRQLFEGDAPKLQALHARLPEKMRWFVEIDHPIVFGCFVKGQLAAAASHYLFEPQKVAAVGAVTHPDFRRRGFGKAVVSAAVAWAHAHGYVCEWSTWLGNRASMALCRSVGFEQWLVDTEYRI